MLGPTLTKVITSQLRSIPQALWQILTREGETYRLIYNLSISGGVRSLKIRPQPTSPIPCTPPTEKGSLPIVQDSTECTNKRRGYPNALAMHLSEILVKM